MRLTEGELRALRTSALLVLLAAVGRTLLHVPAAAPVLSGIERAGDPDSALAVADSIRRELERRKAPLAPGERIDLNTADEIEIDRLPGIGAAKARAIVRTRDRAGGFRSADELVRVPGIGPATAGRLEAHVWFSGPTGPRTEPSREDAFQDRGGQAAGGRPTAGEGRRVDVNRATAEELTALPGIGPTRARAIVRWREERGPFRRLEDLLGVPGIGPATLERLRPHAAVGP